MKFYNREAELKILETTQNASLNSSKMTFIVGRRRTGKTRLISEFCSNKSFIYLFVAKKDEKLLCREFTEEIKAKINIEIYGEINSFKNIFKLLMSYSKDNPITLVIDEFQEFSNINPSIYSDMQNIWDTNKDTTKLNLILCGSVFTMMKKIFENTNEPLFGRANEKINLKPFNVNVIKQILYDYSNNYTFKDLLVFYIFTGGVAKYIETFVEKNALTLESILDLIFSENSLFIDEGKNILIEEFGKEYTTYFSILSLIASSKTSRSDIESILEKNIGGYIERLEKEYNIIEKVKPIFAKPESRNQKYFIKDNFLNFWFRFIYKHRSAIEIGNFEYIKSIVIRDFDSFSGKFLENYFKEKLALSGKYSEIGNYWDKNSQNEIDIIAVNNLEKKALIAEVKINKEKINLKILKEKASNLKNLLSKLDIEYCAYSLEDM